MTEAAALAQSSGWVRGALEGYLPLSAANALVRTGHWEFHQVTPWGYVVRRVSPEVGFSIWVRPLAEAPR